MREKYEANLKIKNVEIDNFIVRKRRLFQEKSEKLSVKLEFHKQVAEAAAQKINRQDLVGKNYHWEQDGNVTIINEVKTERLPAYIKEVLKPDVN